MATMHDPRRSVQSRMSDEKGMALVVAMVLLAMLAFLGSAALLTSSTELDIAANERTYQVAFYGADGGTEVSVRVTRDALSGDGNPSYDGGSGVSVGSSFYANLRTPDGVVDHTDVQIASLTDLQVGVAVDLDPTLPKIPIGGQIPEPGSGYGGEKTTFNLYYDLNSESSGPRNAVSEIDCTYKCAYDGAGCLRDD